MSLSALLERVEAATGGDRELDRDIAIATGWVHRSGAPWERVLEWERPNPTASVDAALALIGRVKPGARALMEHDHDGNGWAMLMPSKHSERFMAEAPTPALALILALLRALLSKDTTHE
ncbi:MAG: hypothetical protein WC718_01305 [Phycisphaerales bacterium]|jgi:hypothetical protein